MKNIIGHLKKILPIFKIYMGGFKLKEKRARTRAFFLNLFV